MALATTPVVPVIRPACKRRVEKPSVVIEDTRPDTCSYHKHYLAILMNIFEKITSMTCETYNNKITKIAEMITCQDESDNIFKTFCGVSFLDRYLERPIIARAMQDLDKKISKGSWQMTKKLQDKCIQLLTRMSMIENLSSQDADLILLLCRLCKSSDQSSPFYKLLLEIGRSVWPYIKRPLWHSETFIDFVADIFETIGNRLEQLYPKNFGVAWKAICKNLATKTEMSGYSSLRLLVVFEHRHTNWSLRHDVMEFYRKEYNELTDNRKKEILSFLGFLSSKRKTSLTVKPGRSAADFLKKRQSCESQEVEEHSSSFFGECTDHLSEVFEDESSDSVFSPNSSTDSFRNEILSNTAEAGLEENSARKTSAENIKSDHGQTVFETRNNCVKDTKTIVDNKHNVPQDSSEIEKNVHTSENKECDEIQSENLDRVNEELGGEKEMKSEKMEEENIWQETGSIWQESENCQQENGSMWEDMQCTDVTLSSPEHDESLSTEKSKNVPERRSFLLDRKREIIKVPEKYVGRVIGSQGSVITSIQDESGARVRIVRPPKEKVVPSKPTFSMSTVKNMVHNSLGIPLSKTSTTDDDLTLKDESEENEEQTVVKDEQQEEFEFEMIGTDENIEKAKLKIESIISHAKSLENHAKLKRSFSDGDEASFHNGFRRSFYQERKKVIMKVGKKYVGRVIGACGSMIMTIEEESGAKVTFVKDKRTEKYKAREQERNMEHIRETDDETSKEIEHEERTELSKETDEINEQEEEKVDAKHNGVDNGEFSKEKRCIESENGSLPGKGDDSETTSGSSEESSVEVVDGKVEEKTVEEYDFEIFGTDESIEKAKRKIEFIIKLVDSQEKKPFTRSLSYSAPRRGFKSFQRSLSCPIENWGDRCTGECESCRKGCYCRSFLLEKSESPACWVRPEALALTQDADWAEFIVKTKVDDPTLWRPRKSSDASVNGGSIEDITNGPTNPRDVTADDTAISLEPAVIFPSGNTSGLVGNMITEDATKQPSEDAVFSDSN